jgi:hypothetical protein
VNRDQLLYIAGKASTTGSLRAWQASACLFAVTALALGGVLWFQAPRVETVERTVYVEVPAPTPAPEPIPEPIPEPPPSPEPPERIELVRAAPPEPRFSPTTNNEWLTTRQHMLRWGAEILPDRPPRPQTSDAEDIRHWLGLPLSSEQGSSLFLSPMPGGVY